MHSRITLSHTAFFNVRVSPTRATSLKHTRHVPARRLPARDPGGPAAFTACSIGFASKLLLAVCGTTRQERPSDRAHHMRPPTGVLPVISGTAPLLPLLQLLLSSPLLHVRSRVQGCSQGHRSRVCVRQHTPASGATRQDASYSTHTARRPALKRIEACKLSKHTMEACKARTEGR